MRIKWVKQFSATLKRFFPEKSEKNFRFLFLTMVFYVSIALVCTSVSMYLSSMTIGSRGAVKTSGLGVYWDKACSRPVSYIDWGIVDPGYTKNVTVYMRNEGNVPASISLDAVNWNPQNASSYITFSWDYSGQLLEPNESVEVALTLLISPSVQNVTNFNFDIVITQA